MVIRKKTFQIVDTSKLRYQGMIHLSLWPQL